MSTGEWVPPEELEKTRIDSDWLQRCIAAASSDTAEAAKTVSADDLAIGAPLMRAGHAAWKPTLSAISDDSLLTLLRFFTLAEAAHPEWEAGELSPAIWINKELRSRGQRLDQETLLWIRENSSNRFIPNGPLL